MNELRIYVYKIIFLEVPHYYYGAHKEKKFNEYYMGSPVTHKDFWQLYTPVKEIIKEFPFTDEGWKAAREFEDNLIKPVFNTDPLCLNENYGGKFSLESSRRAGKYVYESKIGMFGLTKEEKIKIAKRNGHLSYINGTGVFSIEPERKSELSRNIGQKLYEEGLGIFAMTPEEKTQLGIKNGERNKNLNLGICGLSKEERIENGKKYGHIGGQKAVELGVGIHALTPEQKSEAGKMGGKISGANHRDNGTGCFSLTKEEKIKVAQKVNAQRWQCTVTGYITSAGPLSRYQKARGIDTKNRIKIL